MLVLLQQPYEKKMKSLFFVVHHSEHGKCLTKRCDLFVDIVFVLNVCVVLNLNEYDLSALKHVDVFGRDKPTGEKWVVNYKDVARA